MKRFLCLLLSLLLLASLAACKKKQNNATPQQQASTTPSETPTQPVNPVDAGGFGSVEELVAALRKKYATQITKDELNQMYPPAYWGTEYAPADLEDAWVTYESNAAQTREEFVTTYGEDYTVTMVVEEQENVTSAAGLTEADAEKYGVTLEEMQVYSLTCTAVIKGTLAERSETHTTYVVEIHGRWYPKI